MTTSNFTKLWFGDPAKWESKQLLSFEELVNFLDAYVEATTMRVEDATAAAIEESEDCEDDGYFNTTLSESITIESVMEWMSPQ